MDIDERGTISAIESAVTHLSSEKLALLIREFQKEIEQLKEEKEALRLGYNEVMGETLLENTKLKEENKALLGVIDGMKLIIKELENG